MKMYFRKKMQRQKMEDERVEKEREEQKRKIADEKKEADRLREAEAREARLEARLVRLVSQHSKTVHSTTTPVIKKKSPRTKARMLREICSYIDESEDESEEVRHEAGRLVDAIERRKGKRREGEEKAMSTTRVGATKATPVIEEIQEEMHTPHKETHAGDGVNGGMLEFVLEMHKKLSAKKAPELRKICNEEGIEWTRKDAAVSEIVRCRAKLIFGEGSVSDHVSPLSRRIRQLYRKRPTELIALFKTANTFERKSTRNLLKIRITRVVKAVFGTKIRSKPIIKLPFSTGINPRGVRDVVTKILEQRIREPSLAKYVSARIRVVFRKRFTVGQVIHNQRVCAGASAVTCTCKGIDLPRYQGHVKVRLDDIPRTPNFVMNSRNVTCGEDATRDEVRVCVKEGVRKWVRSRDLEVNGMDVAACFRENKARVNQAMTVQEVRRWFRSLEHLIVVSLDRNPGATLIVCPVLYLEACEATFNHSPSFYVIRESEEGILKTMKEEYEERGLTKIGGWGKGGKVGQAYVIPKDKDTERWRPISPANKDPARLGGSRVGRAVRYMLLGIGESKHFDLRCTDELCMKAALIQRELRRMGDFAIARSYDIKDIFARLSRSSIIEAVRWVIDFHKERGMIGVRVSIRRRLCMMARNRKRTEGFILIDFDLLISAIQFELDNTFIRCAGEFLRQIFGIPMGRNSSPALACLVCARSEAVFLETLGSDRRLVQGIRMVDDVTVIVACREERERSVLVRNVSSIYLRTVTMEICVWYVRTGAVMCSNFLERR
ncbi:hypothetical protein CBR_g12217 [Chara braunii]|uniref:Reverse transcriptase domain-containing protein n=1 Tax=Chara braunii TaxID=69332 RepID=A0A388KRT1_CHABU|nr:hypothetical protein CBR_g12217 [Chara braunii]|eukprot:GBG72643.1 hypothetical protein CBR_g12217 [Chara braunii]